MLVFTATGQLADSSLFFVTADVAEGRSGGTSLFIAPPGR